MLQLFLSLLVLIFFGTSFIREAHSALVTREFCDLALKTTIIDLGRLEQFQRRQPENSSLNFPPNINKVLIELNQWEILSHPSLTQDTLLENQGMWQIRVTRVDDHPTDSSLRNIIFEIENISGQPTRWGTQESGRYQVAVPKHDWSSAHYEELALDRHHQSGATPTPQLVLLPKPPKSNLTLSRITLAPTSQSGAIVVHYEQKNEKAQSTTLESFELRLSSESRVHSFHPTTEIIYSTPITEPGDSESIIDSSWMIHYSPDGTVQGSSSVYFQTNGSIFVDHHGHASPEFASNHALDAMNVTTGTSTTLLLTDPLGFATSGRDGAINLYHLGDTQPRAQLNVSRRISSTDPTYPNAILKISADAQTGHWLADMGDRSLRLWDLRTLSVLFEGELPLDVDGADLVPRTSFLEFTPDGRFLTLVMKKTSTDSSYLAFWNVGVLKPITHHWRSVDTF